MLLSLFLSQVTGFAVETNTDLWVSSLPAAEACLVMADGCSPAHSSVSFRLWSGSFVWG